MIAAWFGTIGTERLENRSPWIEQMLLDVHSLSEFGFTHYDRVQSTPHAILTEFQIRSDFIEIDLREVRASWLLHAAIASCMACRRGRRRGAGLAGRCVRWCRCPVCHDAPQRRTHRSLWRVCVRACVCGGSPCDD